jgi:hypothetical protein
MTDVPDTELVGEWDCWWAASMNGVDVTNGLVEGPAVDTRNGLVLL